jgi:hypothetical protein
VSVSFATAQMHYDNMEPPYAEEGKPEYVECEADDGDEGTCEFYGDVPIYHANGVSFWTCPDCDTEQESY